MRERVISDGVVTLRPWRDSDLADMVEMCQDAEIVRWTRLPSPYGEDDARRYLADQSRCAEEGTSFDFAITDASNDNLLGSISVRIVAAGIGDVGYFVRAEAQHRGIGKRSLGLVSLWAHEELELVRLQITIRSENVLSRRLAESCGYRYEGVLRRWLEIKGEHVDAAIYSLLPDEAG